MLPGKPSHTAQRVALRRAAHQVFDRPLVFPDPLALRILGMSERDVRSGALRAPQRPSSSALRAFLVARSRFAEDTVTAVHREHCAARGETQYVLLGAGLDTFSYRNTDPGLRVFEVDHPDTQLWKQGLLHANGIPVPATCAHVAVDFERDSLTERLLQTGFQPHLPAVVAWLGVVVYLSHAAMRATLGELAALPDATHLLLDYSLPREALGTEEQQQRDSLSARVAATGEPFQTFFTPGQMRDELGQHGFCVLEDLDSAALNARYFANRQDGLQVLGSGARLLHARKEPSQAAVANTRAQGATIPLR